MPLYQRVSVTRQLTTRAHQFLLDNRSYHGTPGLRGADAARLDRAPRRCWWIAAGCPSAVRARSCRRWRCAERRRGDARGRVAQLPSPGLALGARRRRRAPGRRSRRFPTWLSSRPPSARRSSRASCCSMRRRRRLRARLAAAGHVAAAALLLRDPVVELRGAGAVRVDAHRCSGADGGVHERPATPRCARVTCAPSRCWPRLFLLPLALAFFTYYGSSWRPPARQPRRAHHAAAAAAGGRSLRAAAAARARAAPRCSASQWSLVYVGAGGCEAACRAGALRDAPDAPRAQQRHDARARACSSRPRDCCARAFLAHEHAGLVVLDAQGAAAARAAAQFPARRARTRCSWSTRSATS